MALKKDSNAVSIDMLLIVHSEKRRAVQGTHSDRQADPGALPQRRGGGVANSIRNWQKLEGSCLDGNLAEKQHPQQTQVITSYDNQDE